MKNQYFIQLGDSKLCIFNDFYGLAHTHNMEEYVLDFDYFSEYVSA